MTTPSPWVAGLRGPDVRNDCWIQLTPHRSDIHIESTVKALYEHAIRSTIRQTLDRLGLQDVGAEVIDTGAFDFCLRARTEAAASKLIPGGKPQPIPSSTPTAQSKNYLRRTRLYLPGNTPKFFINAGLHGSDALIFDLEDSVAENEKDDARWLVRYALAELNFQQCERMVRVNTGLRMAADVEWVQSVGADLLVIPKVASTADVAAVPGSLPILALIESTAGVLSARDIAAHPRVVAISLGMEDYSAELGVFGDGRSTESPHHWAHGQIVHAAKANGKQALGSVFSHVEDVDGFAQHVRRMANLGYDGLSCLHPSQIEPARKALDPTDEAIHWARSVLKLETTGGVASLAGTMVDAPVLRRAQSILERAKLAESRPW